MENIDSIEKIYRSYFADKKIDFAFLYPTKTGLQKSIFDATKPIVDLLSRTGLHDYQIQGQGNLNKIRLPTVIIADKLRNSESSTSLYRPETKNGDPRLWPSNANRFLTANSTCAVAVYRGSLLIVNCDRTSTQKLDRHLSELYSDKTFKSTNTDAPEKFSQGYHLLNSAINEHITSGSFTEKELYLDFEGDFCSNIARLANVNDDELTDLILEAAKRKILQKPNDPFGFFIAKSDAWRRSKFNGLPPTTLFLSFLSIVSEQMSQSDDFGHNNFYDRLIAILGIENPEHERNIRNKFKDTKKVWEDFNDWLLKNDGKFGYPTARSIIPAWTYISYGISQALLRDGDKQHIAKALEDRRGQFLGGIDKGQAYDFLNFYLNSSMSNKYLRDLWQIRSLRPKIIETTLEEAENINFETDAETRSKRLYLRVQLSTYPFRAYKPTIVFRNTNGSIERELYAEKSTVKFCSTEKVHLIPSTSELSVLGNPAELAMNQILLNPIHLVSKEPVAERFKFSPRRATALQEVEPGIYEQVNRPEIFKKHIIICQKSIKDKVNGFLLSCADMSFVLNEKPRGLPQEFVIFENVTFMRSIPEDEIVEAHDPMYWLRPIETMKELDIIGGMKIANNIYHRSSQLQLLISSNKEEVQVSIKNQDEDFNTTYAFMTEKGVGSIKIPQIFGEPFPSYTDLNIDVKLTNYSPTKISFRSARDAKSSGKAPSSYQFSNKNPLGIVSAQAKDIEASTDVTAVSGMIIEQGAIIPSISNATMHGSNQIKFDRNHDIEHTEYHRIEGYEHPHSCFIGGIHIWKFPYQGPDVNLTQEEKRVGTCSVCAETRILPSKKIKKTESNKNTSSYIFRNYSVLPKNRSQYNISDLQDCLCYLQELSWEKFRQICEPFHEENNLYATNLVRKLTALGITDVTLDPNSLRIKRISIAPSVLLKVENKLILLGFRTKQLIKDIQEILGPYEPFKLDYEPDYDIETVSFTASSDHAKLLALNNVTDHMGRKINISSGFEHNLIDCLPNFRTVYEALPETSVSTKSIQKFNPQAGKWQNVDYLSEAGGYRQIWPSYDYFVKTKDGKIKQSTFEISKLYAADLQSSPLHYFNENSSSFISKIGCELPPLLQRALIAFSGKLPDKNHSGEIHYKNVNKDQALKLLNKIQGQC